MTLPEPLSKQLIAEEVNGYYLTTASWETGYGLTYETGIRNLKNGTFTLVQHSGRDYEEDHQRVKKLIGGGCPPQDVWERLQVQPGSEGEK